MVTEESENAVIFDRTAVRRHRERSARLRRRRDFLIDEVGQRLMERVGDFNREFSTVLDLGCRTGEFGRRFTESYSNAHYIYADPAQAMAEHIAAPVVVADDEMLPFRPESFDLIVSLLNLHWVNDLPGALIQIRRCLRPDGVFLAALFGGDTLKELRQALIQAELEIGGGASPRIAPLIDIRDAGGLLQRAGFALPMADVDTISVMYSDPFTLLHDLRAMGETNALRRRDRRFTSRRLWQQAATHYHEQFATSDGRLPATFQIIFLTGWRPDGGQPQPLRPGSAQHRLADALATEERPLDDKARP